MGQISERDVMQFRELLNKDVGVLQPVNKQFLYKHVEVVCCSDGHQFTDLFLQQMVYCTKERSKEQALKHLASTDSHPVVHPLALNGGALLIPFGSPLNQELGEDRIILAHLKNALDMKKELESIVLYVHAPCGAAGKFNLELMQVVEYVLMAKMRIRIEVTHRKMPIACLLHIDKGNGDKNTYFVSKTKWKEWLLRPENKERQDRWQAYEKSLNAITSRQKYLDR